MTWLNMDHDKKKITFDYYDIILKKIIDKLAIVDMHYRYNDEQSSKIQLSRMQKILINKTNVFNP